MHDHQQHPDSAALVLIEVRRSQASRSSLAGGSSASSVAPSRALVAGACGMSDLVRIGGHATPSPRGSRRRNQGRRGSEGSARTQTPSEALQRSPPRSRQRSCPLTHPSTAQRDPRHHARRAAADRPAGQPAREDRSLPADSATDWRSSQQPSYSRRLLIADQITQLVHHRGLCPQRRAARRRERIFRRTLVASDASAAALSVFLAIEVGAGDRLRPGYLLVVA